MTKKAIGKNSKLNKNDNAVTLKNENIKNNTEKIGFFVQTTNIDEVKQNAENNKKRFDFINIYRKLLLFSCVFNTIDATSCFTL